MVNCRHVDQEVTVEQVQITDLENAAYLPKGRCIKGMLAGNDNWRSPEAHFKGELNKPSDMFSFGAVVSVSIWNRELNCLCFKCIYAVLGRVIFGSDDDFQHHRAKGALPALIRLQRQVSYFGNQESVNGLMKHVGDEEINCQILRMLWEDRNEDGIPYKPFSDWTDVDDAEFKDLVLGTMNLDPTKRITARQALEHAWFADSD